MRNWTHEQANAYMRRRMAQEPRERERMQNAKNHTSPEGLSADVAERAEGRTLVRSTSGEAAGGVGAPSRFAIRFIVRSRRPMDWDNAGGGSLKRLQDLLVEALRILPGDGWNVIQGTVISEKCDTAEEEGVVIVIETI